MLNCEQLPETEKFMTSQLLTTITLKCADARLKLEKINSLSEAGVRRARVQPPVAALARSVATKRGGGREQSDSVVALHPVFGQYWKALPRCRPRDMRCTRITEGHVPRPGALANMTRHLALAEAVRILAGLA